MNETLRDQVALITGASGGIGGAVAEALARAGVRLLLAGRDAERLEESVELARAAGSPRAEAYAADLTDDAAVAAIAEHLETSFGGVDVVVHSAGLFRAGALADAPVADLDDQYQVNVRAPYLLTQALLPALRRRQGQIVFINSSAGLNARATVGAYGATKHALKALADALRGEVNGDGVRVVTVYPGRTASAMQAEVHRFEGKTYHPERFLQPADVAAAVVHTLALPRTAEVTDLNIRPMQG